MPPVGSPTGCSYAEIHGRICRGDAAEPNQVEAAQLLGVGERTFCRWCRRYEEEGEAGLLDRRIGKASGKRIPVDRREEIGRLYRTRYRGFTARHFHENLVRDHRFAWSYSWTKIFQQRRNLLAKAERRGARWRKLPVKDVAPRWPRKRRSHP
jgi:transposase